MRQAGVGHTVQRRVFGTRKLGCYLEAQQAVVDSIEEVAADLLGFCTDILSASGEQATTYLLIGTERGFCGDFNHALPRRLESMLQAHPPNHARLITAGHELHVLLEDDERVAARIEGTSEAEEVTAVLNPLVNELSKLHEAHGPGSVQCLYHGADDMVLQELLPPFKNLRHAPPQFAHPPELNQPPGDFLLELTGHYLVAALHRILYTSLMAENHHRIAHLDGAVRHLDNEAAELTRRCNALRQEEIVEEIKVIPLSAASLGSEAGKWDH